VRNIRTTTGQSRPMAVSTLPQPVAEPVQIQAPVETPVVPEATPASIETPPAPAPAPELIEEEPSTPDDEAEVAVITAPIAATAASAVADKSETITISELQSKSNVTSERSASPVKAPAKIASIAAPKSRANSSAITTEINMLSSTANVKTKIAPSVVRAPAKTVAAVKSQPAAKTLAAPRAAARRIRGTVRPVPAAELHALALLKPLRSGRAAIRPRARCRRARGRPPRWCGSSRSTAGGRPPRR